MTKQNKKTPFVSREKGAKARQEQTAVVKQETHTAQVITEDVNPFVQLALSLKVENEQDYADATEMLLKVKASEKKAEEEKNKMIKPLNEALKVERARWKPLEVMFEKINSIVRPKMLKFVNAREAKATADLAALDKQIESGQIKDGDKVAKKMEAIYSSVPDKSVHTGTGSSNLRKVATLVITDRNLIPDEYWVIDEVKLRKDVVSLEKEVPGAKREMVNSLAII